MLVIIKYFAIIIFHFLHFKYRPIFTYNFTFIYIICFRCRNIEECHAFVLRKLCEEQMTKERVYILPPPPQPNLLVHEQLSLPSKHGHGKNHITLQEFHLERKPTQYYNSSHQGKINEMIPRCHDKFYYSPPKNWHNSYKSNNHKYYRNTWKRSECIKRKDTREYKKKFHDRIYFTKCKHKYVPLDPS